MYYKIIFSCGYEDCEEVYYVYANNKEEATKFADEKFSDYIEKYRFKPLRYIHNAYLDTTFIPIAYEDYISNCDYDIIKIDKNSLSEIDFLDIQNV